MQNSMEPKDEDGFGSMMPPPPRDAAAGGWGAGAADQIDEPKMEEVQVGRATKSNQPVHLKLASIAFAHNPVCLPTCLCLCSGA
jgi:hypothetical protein